MQNTSISQRVFTLEAQLEQLRRSVARVETTNDGLKFKLEQALRQLSALVNLVSQNTKYKDYLEATLRNELDSSPASAAPPSE